jgi:hypothetical protein
MRPTVLAAALVCFAILATANSGGYRYGISDQAFYAPAVVMASHPDLFPRDRALLEPQLRLWPGGQILGAVTQWAGGDLPLVFAVFYAVTLVALAWSAVTLGRSLGLDWRAILVFLALLTLRHRIAKTGANSLEGYAHPRMLAFAVGLAVFAAIARGERVRAILLSALSFLIHTTTGAWFSLVLAFSLLWPHRHRRWVFLGAGVLLCAGMVVLFSPNSPLSQRMDPAWLMALEDKDYLFSGEWPLYAWLSNLAYPVVLWLVFRRRQARGLLAPGETALVAGLMGLVVLFLVSVPFAQARLAIVVQLQINRVFWLLDAATTLSIAWLAIDLTQPPRGETARTTTAAWAVMAAVCVAASVRGYYVLRVEAHRPLVQLRPEANTWMDVMTWLSRQPTSWHVLADPGHVWKYGLSVRVAASRDTLLEAGKDTALAMYDRESALRVAERAHALAGFETLTTADVRALDAAYRLDVFVDRATRVFDLPVLYRNQDFVVYDLR